jgi:hypothetical protein
MSSNATRRLEAWLVFAGILAAMAWYARPQLAYSLGALRYLVELLAGSTGN